MWTQGNHWVPGSTTAPNIRAGTGPSLPGEYPAVGREHDPRPEGDDSNAVLLGGTGALLERQRVSSPEVVSGGRLLGNRFLTALVPVDTDRGPADEDGRRRFDAGDCLHERLDAADSAAEYLPPVVITGPPREERSTGEIDKRVDAVEIPGPPVDATRCPREDNGTGQRVGDPSRSAAEDQHFVAAVEQVPAQMPSDQSAAAGDHHAA